MKIGICGDQHWTANRPANRTDDYASVLMEKLAWEIDTFTSNMCGIVCFPGDLFDSYKVPYGVCEKAVTTLIQPLRFSNIQYCCVYGQHDQRYHTISTDNTPLGVLLAAVPDMILLNKDPFRVGNVCLYGASWGEDIPEITTPDDINVFVTHRMVIGDTKLWEQQTDYTEAKGLLSSTKFDLIVTGDNHQRVIQQDIRKRAVVNLGSMMRSSIAQVDHVPSVAIYDTDTRDLNIIPIPIKPSNEVFALEKATAEKERDEKLEVFVNSLQDTDSVRSLDFCANVNNFVCANKDAITNGVLAELNEIMQGTLTKLEV